MKSQANDTKALFSQRKWLREASMRRLSSLVKNKTETIDSATKLQLNIDKLEDGLEESGLNSFIISQLNDWVNGLLTGRQAMLAILDSFHNEMSNKYSNFSFYKSGFSGTSSSSVSTKKSSKDTKAVSSEIIGNEKEELNGDKEDTISSKTEKGIKNESNESEFQPLDILRLSLNLPEQFLCDSGFLYSYLFSQPPLSLIRRIMEEIILTKTNETSSRTLNLSQINIAIKQMKIDAFCGINYLSKLFPATTSSSSESSLTCPPSPPNSPSSSSLDKKEEEETESVAADCNSLENILFTNICIELLRIHILSSIQKKTLLLTLQQYNYNTNPLSSEQHDQSLYVFNHLSSSQRSNHSTSSNGLLSAAAASASSKKKKQLGEDGSNVSHPMLEYYLNIPMKTIQDETLQVIKDEKKKDMEKRKKDSEGDDEDNNDDDEGESEIKASSYSSFLDSSSASSKSATSSAVPGSIPSIHFSPKGNDIESINSVLKPYLKQLSLLKQLLTTNLKNVKESRAYMIFGLNVNANEDMVKRAYRTLAIKFHPDKPGILFLDVVFSSFLILSSLSLCLITLI
jgi:hypothetical protein